ncbi:MAG: site-specific integrase [Bacteroides sp.]|nr:site-specific integrase [Bacteroides sp.]MCM1389205.1 site-specific integrase [Bacteroides sp.]
MSNFKFKEIASKWCDEKRNYVKRSTFAAYALMISNHLIPAFGESYSLTETSVQDFVLDKLSDGLSPKTVKDILIVLKMIVRYGYKLGMFPLSEWEIKYPTERKVSKPQILTISDQRKLMKYLTDNFSFRNLGILICLHTGTRIGEICGMQWNDIDIHQGIIVVSRTIERIYIAEDGLRKTELIVSSPKTHNSKREIPITTELHKILKPLKAIVKGDFYVLSNKQIPIEPRTYRNYYKNLLTSLDIPPIKFHGLRHSFATRCIESKCDYKTVSSILGHSNISTTLNLYVHPNIGQKKRCVNKMMKSIGKM